jgi:ADP-ribose pyrophosphatase YjhB (NUDIX family)
MGAVARRVACRAVDLLPFAEYAAQLNRKRTSAGVLIRAAGARVLLVQTSYAPPGIDDNWEIPGGAGEADEPPWTTAARERGEELGPGRPLGRLLVIDHVPKEDPMPEGLAFIFDGGVITDAEVAALELPDPEIVAVGLFTIEEAAERVKPALAARLRAAVYAQVNGVVALCESGKRVTGDAPDRA